ncbi:site-specific DNA-methyltransferase [Verrucomicrobia bacterium]|nr:site-specific DNA-methyltransferase [Verrucomicrobiota bacterium]
MAKKKTTKRKTVDHLTHEEAKRKNIPPAEVQGNVREEVKTPVQVAYERRNPDLDPQLVWRGKDDGPLDVSAPPLYIQEKVHPKALMDDLLRQTRSRSGTEDDGYHEADLFSDFNGLPEEAKSTDFYRHEGHWSNRMILGDGLQVMASLAEREGLRGKVQCIYIDPPYGIKFNSNFQWSTTSKEVKDGKADHLTREPEQVKAFRDTWRDGIHSYLTYLRDRLIASRDLLTDSGSVFVQIGDENVHRVRAVMDEVFGGENFISLITFKKTHYQESENVGNIADYLLLYAKDIANNKHRKMWSPASLFDVDFSKYTKAFTSSGIEKIPPAWRKDPSLFEKDYRPLRSDITLTQDGESGEGQKSWNLVNKDYFPGRGRHWRTHEVGRQRLWKAGRVNPSANRPFYIEGYDDSPSTNNSNIWTEDLAGAQGKVYVVQTNERVLDRCIQMTTDPGDLVLDPTCGSGTTAFVAEKWGRRWITIDTSRVALALARARIMGAKYPYYLLSDSKEGQNKEAEITRATPSEQPVHNSIRQGFVYERVPHITLKSIANNAEIDVIYDEFQQKLEPLRELINKSLKESWEEWEIPREADEDWPDEAKTAHADWWEQRIARQKEIDASIAAKADSEYLYDRPYENKSKIRVSGPFTVESVSPHRIISVGGKDELIDSWDKVASESDEAYGGRQQDYVSVILDNLKTAGVQQSQREDRIIFSGLTAIAGNYICAEGNYIEGDPEDDKAPQRRAGIFIGPEFGTVSRPDLVAAAKEAGDMGFDVLIACAFNYDAHSAEFGKLGALPILKARMNADLHMADDLKKTDKGNLFVIFGEPDIDIENVEDGQIQVRINGVDIFKPSSGEVVSSDPGDIACWFIDTDYNEESFFVRHAYFLGQNDPYKSLKTTLKAEIDKEAWDSLNRDVSRPFPKPSTGRIAIKVINHLGDEVMKVFSVS